MNIYNMDYLSNTEIHVTATGLKPTLTYLGRAPTRAATTIIDQMSPKISIHNQ